MGDEVTTLAASIATIESVCAIAEAQSKARKSERRVLTVGSLFSGIGGFDLGLERAGMRVIWQSEIDPYASAVLRKHWPDIPNHGDIRTIFSGSVERPDVICGGFPCQDISNAGKGAGIDGERSGLWSEYARVIGELQPRFVLVENVSALLNRGMGRVLGDLAALGFDAEWHCIPASAVGAPHRRDRVWIIAFRNTDSDGQSVSAEHAKASLLSCVVADAAIDGCDVEPPTSGIQTEGQAQHLLIVGDYPRREFSWWNAEPDVGRVANGIPRRVDRLRCLGNAIVPQVAEVIGRAVMAAA